MDAYDDRMRDALKRAVPPLEETDVFESVVRRGRSARHRRRVEAAVAGVVAVTAAAFMIFGVAHALRNLPPAPPVVSSPAPERIPVSGTVTLLQDQTTNVDSPGGGFSQARTGVWVLRADLSDARVSGTIKITFGENVRADQSSVMWGTSVLSNPAGTWECAGWSGATAKGGQEHLLFLQYKGTGMYAGLKFSCQLYRLGSAGAAGQTLTVSGRIEPASP
jgi:hypothetical protein